MSLSREHESILQVLRSFVASAPLDRDAAWDRLSWGGLFDVVRYHKLIPIFYHVLSREALLEKMPVNEREALREGYLENSAHALFYEDFLRKLLLSLKTAGIAFVILKGPSIAYEFYDPVEMRPYNDIDLLVREGDYERTKSALSSLGMGVAEPEREAIRRRYFNSVVYTTGGKPGVMLDLHWETLMVSWNRRPFLSGRAVWDRIRRVNSSGLDLPVLQPEHENRCSESQEPRAVRRSRYMATGVPSSDDG